MATFSAEVERWRALVAKYFPPSEVDNALMIMSLESGGRNIPSGYNAGGGEDSHGLFQINLDAHGSRINRDQVYDPEQNIAYAARLFADQGWQPWSASRTQAFQSFRGTGGTAGGGGTLTSSAGYSNVKPQPNINPDDFLYEVLDADGFPTGEKRMDWESYYSALNQQKSYMQSDQQNNDAYYAALIDEIGLEIDAGRLKLDQAQGEFDRRFRALQEGNRQFAELVGYAIPNAGGPYPNSEFYAGMGLQPTIPTTSSIDPFGMALDIVNQTPNLTQLGVPTVPDISGMIQSDLAAQRSSIAPPMAGEAARDSFNAALDMTRGTLGNVRRLSENPIIAELLSRSGQQPTGFLDRIRRFGYAAGGGVGGGGGTRW